MADEYEVGYGKPPKSGQFLKGQSGNRRGRPKGAKNFKTIINDAARAKVFITSQGQKKSVSKLEASAIQFMNKAVTGDTRAFKEFATLFARYEAQNEPELAEITDESDKKVVQSIVQRIQQSHQEKTTLTPAEPHSTGTSDDTESK